MTIQGSSVTAVAFPGQQKLDKSIQLINLLRDKLDLKVTKVWYRFSQETGVCRFFIRTESIRKKTVLQINTKEVGQDYDWFKEIKAAIQQCTESRAATSTETKKSVIPLKTPFTLPKGKVSNMKERMEAALSKLPDICAENIQDGEFDFDEFIGNVEISLVPEKLGRKNCPSDACTSKWSFKVSYNKAYYMIPLNDENSKLLSVEQLLQRLEELVLYLPMLTDIERSLYVNNGVGLASQFLWEDGVRQFQVGIYLFGAEHILSLQRWASMKPGENKKSIALPKDIYELSPEELKQQVDEAVQSLTEYHMSSPFKKIISVLKEEVAKDSSQEIDEKMSWRILSADSITIAYDLASEEERKAAYKSFLNLVSSFENFSGLWQVESVDYNPLKESFVKSSDFKRPEIAPLVVNIFPTRVLTKNLKRSFAELTSNTHPVHELGALGLRANNLSKVTVTFDIFQGVSKENADKLITSSFKENNLTFQKVGSKKESRLAYHVKYITKKRRGRK